MNGGCAQTTVIGRRQRNRVTAAAASAILIALALAGCAPSESSGNPSPTASPTGTDDATPTPLPTPEPLIVPGCETLLPLGAAKDLFSPDTEALNEEDAASMGSDDLPEIDTAAANASIAKNCVWGVPNSGGFFTLTVANISDTDAANLKAALLSAGYLGISRDGVTMLEHETENAVGTKSTTHYLVADLWIHVEGTSLSLTTDVANSALDEARLANPTRSY